MSDRYQSLINTPVGQLLAKNLGLPKPIELDRYEEGEPLVQGTVVIGGTGRLEPSISKSLDELGITFVREPKQASYGIVAVFEDLYGNLWDLVQFTDGRP